MNTATVTNTKLGWAPSRHTKLLFARLRPGTLREPPRGMYKTMHMNLKSTRILPTLHHDHHSPEVIESQNQHQHPAILHKVLIARQLILFLHEFEVDLLLLGYKSDVWGSLVLESASSYMRTHDQIYFKELSFSYLISACKVLPCGKLLIGSSAYLVNQGQLLWKFHEVLTPR